MKSTTKILFVGLCLFGTALTANAQLKLHSNGNLSFKRTGTASPLSPLSLGNGGTDVSDSIYFMAYQGKKDGLFFYVNDGLGANGVGKRHSGYFRSYGPAAETLVGLEGFGGYSMIESPSNEPGSIGLWGGCTSFAIDRYSYGVLGSAYGQFYSAGVCGIAAGYDTSDAIPDDYYAGFFAGKTKVVGTLTATGGLYDTTLINCPVDPGRSEVTALDNGGMTTSLFQGLTTLAYRNPQKTVDDRPHPKFLEPDSMTLAEMKKMGIDASKLKVENVDVIERQIQDKQHYALSPDELEKVFPDLVYTDKDGGKAINYVEMVPLLVQCINELNARLTTLDGNKAASRKSGLSDSDDNTSSLGAASRVSPINAVLYQNTPNPFNAQTEIRFSLPDDAPSAYIYIFDMTGKMQKQIPVDPQMQSVSINGYELSAGIYLYSLVVGGQEIDTKRMILSK